MSGIARKSLSTFIFRIVTQAFAVAAGILVARVLGPGSKGVYTYVGTIAGLTTMYYAGQSNAIAYEYGRIKRSAQTVFRVAARIFVLTALPASLALAAIAIAVPGQAALTAAACALPFMAVAQMLAGFFLADGDVHTVNVQQLFPSAGFVLLLLPALFVAHMGLSGVLALWVVAYIVMAGYSLVRLRSILDRGSAASDNFGWEQFRFGLRVSLNGVISYLNFRIDVFIILALLGERALGVYSVGIGLGELMWQLSRPVAQAAFGRIGSSEERESAELTATCMRHSLLMVGMGSVVLYFAGPWVATLVYGSAFRDAGNVIRMLLPGIMAYSAMPVLATFFQQQLGRPNIPLTFSALSTVICAVLTYVMVPRWGIVGGAFATSVSYIVAFAAASAYFIRRTKIPARRLFLAGLRDLAAYLQFVPGRS
jgi:O-antigen/teichoic acid export membrane protein